MGVCFFLGVPCSVGFTKGAQGFIFVPRFGGAVPTQQSRKGLTFSTKLAFKTQQSRQRVHCFEQAWSQKATNSEGVHL